MRNVRMEGAADSLVGRRTSLLMSKFDLQYVDQLWPYLPRPFCPTHFSKPVFET